MTITVVGVDKLLATFAEKTVAADVATQVGIDQLGEDALSIARADVPVLTGTLRDSLTYERVSPELGRVYTDVVYASQVEYGGSHNPPEAYMRPAADTVNGEVATAAMKAVIDGA